jgi:hypothetical protein
VFEQEAAAWGLRIEQAKTKVYPTASNRDEVAAFMNVEVAPMTSVPILGHIVTINRSDPHEARDAAEAVAGSFFAAIPPSIRNPGAVATLVTLVLVPKLVHLLTFAAAEVAQHVVRLLRKKVAAACNLFVATPSIAVYTPKSDGGLGMPLCTSGVLQSRTRAWAQWLRHHREALAPTEGGTPGAGFDGFWADTRILNPALVRHADALRCDPHTYEVALDGKVLPRPAPPAHAEATQGSRAIAGALPT